VATLYTKKGKPLTVSGDYVYDRSGRHLGRRRGNKIYGPDGRYRATIVRNTAVYRSVDSAGVSGSYAAPANRVGTAAASRVGSAIQGDEPFE
jgi:hypothetical protein